MIAARDRSGCMLSVFHNRRWDWDFATVKEVLDRGWIGRPLWFESAVCRSAAPRDRGSAAAAGTILHDGVRIWSIRPSSSAWGPAAGWPHG